MTSFVNDTDLDAIEVRWRDEPTGHLHSNATISLGDDEACRTLEAFLEVGNEWDDLGLTVACIASRRSVSTDFRGVTFASDYFGRSGHIYLSDGTEETIEVSEAAGLRLISRWLNVLADGAEQEQLEITSGPSWDDFLRDMEAIQRSAPLLESDVSDDLPGC